MAAKVRHTQTQEELHTNGDTNSPKASNGHLIPLDQKVKDTARKKKKKESAPAPTGLPGAALRTGVAAHPPQGDRGQEGTDLT